MIRTCLENTTILHTSKYTTCRRLCKVGNGKRGFIIYQLLLKRQCLLTYQCMEKNLFYILSILYIYE